MFILSLGLIVAGIGTQSFLRPQMIATLDKELHQMLRNPEAVLGANADARALQCEDVQFAGPRFYVAVLDGDGTLLCDNSQVRADGLAPTPPVLLPAEAEQMQKSTLSLGGTDGIAWRFVVGPIMSNQGGPGGTLFIAASTAEVNRTMTAFALVFSGFGLSLIHI